MNNNIKNYSTYISSSLISNYNTTNSSNNKNNVNNYNNNPGEDIIEITHAKKSIKSCKTIG